MEPSGLPFAGFMVKERLPPTGCSPRVARPTRCPAEGKMVKYIPVFGGWQCPSCGYYSKDPDR